MTTAQVLAVLRRYLDEVDTSVSTLTDEELLAEVSDIRDLFEIELMSGFDELVVVYDQTETGYGIAPDPDLDEGHLLAIRAAVAILKRTYRARMNRGELGVSWQSGLEAESTISAGKAYQDAIQQLEYEWQSLALLKRTPDVGKRQQ